MPEAYAASIEQLRAVAGTARDPGGHAFAVIAEYLRRDGRLEEAKVVAEEGRSRLPDFASGHVVAARILSELGDIEAARAALTRVHELDRDNRMAPGIGQALDAAEEAAALDWARAQGQGPTVEVDPEVTTVTLGELYLEQGAAEKAEEVARRLLEADSADGTAQDLLDRATRAQGDTEQAPEAVDVASLAPDPTDVAELAPAPPDVATLAPEAVPVEELAPDPVPVESLAPSAVPVASLAPEAVPVASLAPEVPEAAPKADTPAKEEDLDDFMSWLDGQ